MNALQTAMQAYATAGMYNAQLTQNYTTMAQMALANNASRTLAPSFGIGKTGASLSGPSFGDSFTRQTSAPNSSSAMFGSKKADSSLANPMEAVSNIQKEEKRLNILQMISSVFERIYASMLKALGRKPDVAISKQDGPTE